MWHYDTDAWTGNSGSYVRHTDDNAVIGLLSHGSRLPNFGILVVACTQAPDGGDAVVHRRGDPPGSPSPQSGLITGYVVDAGAEPVPGINLGVETLSPPFTSSSEGRATLPDGTFAIRRSAGRCRVSAHGPQGTAEVVVELHAGETVTVELQLEKSAAR